MAVTPDCTVRRLTAADAPAYRGLMLEAYALAADAFTSTAEERAAEPMSWWQRRIACPAGTRLALGAFDDAGRLLGSVALEWETKPKNRHRANVLGLYVQPAARGAGLARRLMQALLRAAEDAPALDAARDAVALPAHDLGRRQLTLTVTEGNRAAIGLYERLGFVAWGTEPCAIATPRGLLGKVHMARELRGSGADPAGAAGAG